jgi:hypothetical protein
MMDEQTHSLQEIQEYVQKTHRTNLALQRAFERLVRNLPLPEKEQTERDKLIYRVRSSSGDLDTAVDAFVEILTKRSKKDIQNNRYRARLSTEGWTRLSIPIKNRFDAAHSYSLTTEKGQIGLGPALLALSSATERFLRDTLIDPLFKAIKRDNRQLLPKAPMKFKTATLGQIPFLLDIKGDPDLAYKRFITDWIHHTFSVDKSNYILDVLTYKVSQVAKIRNDWASVLLSKNLGVLN